MTTRSAVSALMFVLAGASLLNAASGARLKAIPAELEPRNAPVVWAVEPGDQLSMKAGPRTNWFRSPVENRNVDNAPMLLFQPAEEFTLSAKVSLQFRSRFDAGALVLYVDELNWAKFAFESPQPDQPMIISVVTRGDSDDCYSLPVTGNTAYLKIAKTGAGFNFYASTDGTTWKVMRRFKLASNNGLRVGFSVQSPRGEGQSAVFSDIHYSPTRIKNLATGE